jgi:2-polyprenyl-6-methoxyphenol hydroxylase-like FAD-dependent oxidoreductase
LKPSIVHHGLGTISELSTMAMSLNVLIVGGGLGGLAAAIALKQKGHHVTVLEAAAKLGEVGAGIQVPPNCVRHLNRLGVADKVCTVPYPGLSGVTQTDTSKVGKESTSPASITIKRWKVNNTIFWLFQVL